MSNFYAVLDDSNTCTGIKEVTEEFVQPDHIAIGFLDTTLLGQSWNGSAWVPAPAPQYAKYTYLAFLEKIMEDEASAAALVTAKKGETPTGAMIEIMMEMIKTMDGVDFNSEVSRNRLTSLVPAIFSEPVAIKILHNT